ncbi:MAG: DUF421 domain-containing protein [Firmicutes bacterium]|nr:DUF421 domain-containing protein [Bacillota bacterium]
MPEYLEISIREIFSYIILFTLTRLMGKREISQLTFFDYVVGITIGTLTGSMVIDTTRNLITILPALLIFSAFQILTSFLSLKSVNFRKLVDGTPTILMKNGNILEKNLKKSRLNVDELISKLREKKVFTLANVEFAILENDGKISVMKKTNKQTVTPSDLGITTSYTGLGKLIIEEGRIKEKKLQKYGLTRSWVLSKLGEQGIYDLSKVLFAQVDENGNLFVDLNDNYNNKDDTNKCNLVSSTHKILIYTNFSYITIQTFY